MKNLFTLFLFLLLTSAFSQKPQKVDIDNYHVRLNCIEFPKHYVSSDERTYSIRYKGTNQYDERVILDAIHINGWDRVESEADVDIVVEVNEFRPGRSDARNRTVENKNKEGKVTSRTTYYWVETDNQGSGDITVYGPKNEWKEKKKKKKKEKKKEEVEENPFLTGIKVKKNTSDKKKSGFNYLNNSYEYKSREFSSAKKARDNFNVNAPNYYDQHAEQYGDYVIAKSNQYINAMYGANPTSHRVKMKILDSDKHREYKDFKNATEASKTLLASTRYDETIEVLRENFIPILEYYESVADRYKTKDKHHKNLRAAARYNMAAIYLCLDLPDKAIEVGESIIASGHDKGDGKDFIKDANKLKSQLTFHQMDSRHINLASEDE